MNAVRFAAPAEFHQLRIIASPINDVQVWQANIEEFTADEILELAATLSPAEDDRAARFYFQRDRHRYVATRGLLRHLLGAALDEPARDLRFENGVHGKPRLVVENMRNLCFNLSHSAGHALFALAWDRDLGIDLESLDRVATDGNELGDLAARVLSERELESWRTLQDPAEERLAFFRAWARKEAYLKATGEGLRGGLQSIEVIQDDHAGNIQWNRVIDKWSIHDLAAPAGFVAALAIEAAGGHSERSVFPP